MGILTSLQSNIKVYLALMRAGIYVIRNDGWTELYRKFRRWLRLKMAASHGPKLKLPKFDNCIQQHFLDVISLPVSSSNPSVSIIIPVFNQLVYTLNCLTSISENNTGDYEVIVVDDCSTDGTIKTLSQIKNLRLIRKDTNSGFIDSCNRGAEASRSKYILFLNNDTMVTTGWLEPLLETLEKDRVGAVGPKLVYGDGTLQSAGAIIFSDGSGWLYGCRDNPSKPEYCFTRPVDYCSGACLLVKKILFDNVGGFDIRFKPAYYDDADLCFAIRNIGYQVIYQPKSLVVHYEGITSGTDVSSGVKKHQVINQPRFVAKWATVLQKSHFNPGEENVFFARNRKPGQNILVLDTHVPTYDKDSGSLRMFQILNLLSQLGHKVTFVGDFPFKIEPYTSELQDIHIEVIYSPYMPTVESYLSNFGKYFTNVILSRNPVAAKYIDLVKLYCPRARVIYDSVDLAFLRESRRAEVEHDNILQERAQRLKESDLLLARHSDITLVVSSVEKDLILKEDPSLKVEILSNIHQVTKSVKPFQERADLLFVGNFDHLPNIDACTFFVKEIFPDILRQIPSIRLMIVGNNPSHEILALQSVSVIVTGYVKDLKPYFDGCRVFVAPLRYGAGVKGKINQAMSYGLPVITTSIGAEGIEGKDGLDFLVADKAKDFTDKTVHLYTDIELWQNISVYSLQNVEKYFSIASAKSILSRLLANAK
jgi:O-antigen biosynthesis protein